MDITSKYAFTMLKLCLDKRTDRPKKYKALHGGASAYHTVFDLSKLLKIISEVLIFDFTLRYAEQSEKLS